MSTSSPSTPENTPQRRMPMNRSFTLPAKIATTSRALPTAEIGATEGVETLYIHPNGKIVKFTSASSSRPGSSYGGPNNQQGNLPWATLTEQTLAAGPIQIYRVPGSVSFLHSGSLLHAILPRSNCWCVDGISKFAIRVLADTYYRIELPGESPEDLEKVEELKGTLKKVLFYERTACPFARTFSVEVPKEPVVRTKRRKSHGPAKKWKLEKAYSWKPEDGGEPPSKDEEESESDDSDEDVSTSNEEEPVINISKATEEVTAKVSTPTKPSVRERARGLNLRSVTAPPQMPVQSTPPSRLRTIVVADETVDDGQHPQPGPSDREPGTLAATALRPFQSIPTAMPPSPPDSSAGFDYTEQTSRTTLPEQEVYVQQQLEGTSGTAASKTQPDDDYHENVAQAGLQGGSADEWQEELQTASVDVQHKTEVDPATATPSQREQVFVTDAGIDSLDARNRLPSSENRQAKDLRASLPEIDTRERSASAGVEQLCVSAPPQEFDVAVVSAVDAEPVDPFAQIQARIQARRSIGGTTSFHPSAKSPTRQSSVSTASSSSLSTRSGASRRAQATQQHQQALATALVRKACSVFLGPPAQLVMIMLRIASRFAKGAFPQSFLFESPAGMSKRVPGSFDLDGSDVEDLGLDEDLEDWDEDDFGVPLRSPIRLATVHEALSRSFDQEAVNLVRERKPATGWDID